MTTPTTGKDPEPETFWVTRFGTVGGIRRAKHPAGGRYPSVIVDLIGHSDGPDVGEQFAAKILLNPIDAEELGKQLIHYAGRMQADPEGRTSPLNN